MIAWTSIEPRSDSELLSLAKFGRNYPDRPLSEVTRENVDEALSFCRSAGTYMRYRTMIAAILNLAKKAKWIADPPLLVGATTGKLLGLDGPLLIDTGDDELDAALAGHQRVTTGIQDIALVRAVAASAERKDRS